MSQQENCVEVCSQGGRMRSKRLSIFDIIKLFLQGHYLIVN